MNSASKQQKTGSLKARKSAARLLAVQAVYQMQKNDQEAESVIAEYLEHRIGMDIDGEEMVTADKDHFALVVRGVMEHKTQLAEMVALNRRKPTEEGAPSKKEPLLQAILVCGGFELMALQDIDFPIIIADYLHVAQAFYDDGESKLVNGLLDSIRKTVRN